MEKQNFQESLLSVVVPVYKVEAYLDRCVESIVNQTYTNLEIILVDDGSPDRCPELCDEWAERDSRIRVIHKENGGAAQARNAGISFASGEYLAFADSDDFLDTDMYETMILAMECTESDVACCGRYIVEADTQSPALCMDKQTLFSGTEAVRELLLGQYVDESPCDKVFRRELFANIRFPEGEINEDIVVLPGLLAASRRVVHTGKPFYYYYQNRTSVTKSKYSANKRVMLKHLDDLKRYLEENNRELLTYFHALQGRYCQSTLYLLLDNKATFETYRADYDVFYARFKQSFFHMLRLTPMGWTEKIKGYLIYFKLYYFLHAVKKGIDNEGKV